MLPSTRHFILLTGALEHPFITGAEGSGGPVLTSLVRRYNGHLAAAQGSVVGGADAAQLEQRTLQSTLWFDDTCGLGDGAFTGTCDGTPSNGLPSGLQTCLGGTMQEAGCTLLRTGHRGGAAATCSAPAGGVDMAGALEESSGSSVLHRLPGKELMLYNGPGDGGTLPMALPPRPAFGEDGRRAESSREHPPQGGELPATSGSALEGGSFSFMDDYDCGGEGVAALDLSDGIAAPSTPARGATHTPMAADSAGSATSRLPTTPPETMRWDAGGHGGDATLPRHAASPCGSLEAVEGGVPKQQVPSARHVRALASCAVRRRVMSCALL